MRAPLIKNRYNKLELVSKMVHSQQEKNKEGSRIDELRETEGALVI